MPARGLDTITGGIGHWREQRTGTRRGDSRNTWASAACSCASRERCPCARAGAPKSPRGLLRATRAPIPQCQEASVPARGGLLIRARLGLPKNCRQPAQHILVRTISAQPSLSRAESVHHRGGRRALVLVIQQLEILRPTLARRSRLAQSSAKRKESVHVAAPGREMRVLLEARRDR